MSIQSISILDSNHDHTEILSGFVENEGYQAQIFHSILEASKGASSIENGVMMLNYQVIVEAERKVVIEFFKNLVKTHRLILYNVPENADQRLAFYELGAQRVFDTSFSLEEVFYSLKWLLRNLTELESDQQLYSKGRLKDTPLISLINSMGRDNRTGVLKIVAKNNSGKIYFHNGDIDDAQVGPHTGMEALIHLLYWREGNFSFTPTLSEKNRNQISLSNVGVILLAEKYHQEFLENLKLLNNLGAIIRVVNKGDVLAMHKDMRRDFIEYLSTPRILEEALENPYYVNYRTMQFLIKLKNSSHLVLAEGNKDGLKFPLDSFHSIDTGFGEVILNKTEIKKLKRNLKVKDDHLGKLLIVAAKTAGKTEFISQITNSARVSKTEQNIDVAQVSFDNELQLLLFGMTMDQMELELTEKLAEGLLGFIFMVDFIDTKKHEYQNYIINHLLSQHPVPHVIAACGTKNAKDLKTMQNNFPSAIKLNWIACKPNDIKSIREVLLSVKPISRPAKKKKGTKK